MTATEQLRKLLDERGVEWSDRANAWTYETHWKGADGKPVCASQRSDGIGDLVLKQHVIPEQAIAATLGSDAKPCYATDYTHARCKYSVNRGWTEDTKFYVPTATLGRGTCEWQGSTGQGWCQGAYDESIEEYDGFTVTRHYFSCGHGALMADGEKPNYCPHCGCEVKR